MTIYRKIGLGIIGLGVIMFFVGASMFTYRGNINPIVSKIGEYSFIFWLPTIILGTIVVAVGKRNKKKY
jgi:multisubunit Na+/H+ antiporter MnhC subunit